MRKSSVITARVTPDVAADLERLAERQDRSRAWLASKAIERYVREESDFLAFLQEGEEAIARGDFVTHEELVAEIRARRQRKDAA
ncbi:ribbon-helix-helix protein, CopG family [Sphingomonas koreensis]|nr:ribbon-helix-helix protein, CopG family [Sphingomonas koreensis]